MKLEQTDFNNLYVLTPVVFEDHRGYFFESFNLDVFYRNTGLKTGFVQDNEAKSDKGVIRGLHYQLSPYAQSKLVRVIQGKVLDVVVDIRKDSPTYGKSFSIVLSAENKKQLFIPKGFAHGYAVLDNDTIFSYKCDAFYHAKSEGGIRFDDPTLNIDWEIDPNEAQVSDKDLGLPFFGDHLSFDS